MTTKTISLNAIFAILFATDDVKVTIKKKADTLSYETAGGITGTLKAETFTLVATPEGDPTSIDEGDYVIEVKDGVVQKFDKYEKPVPEVRVKNQRGVGSSTAKNAGLNVWA